MYYEEKIIDGVLCCRHSPDAAWAPVSQEDMSRKLEKQVEWTSHYRGIVNEAEPVVIDLMKHMERIEILIPPHVLDEHRDILQRLKNLDGRIRP